MTEIEPERIEAIYQKFCKALPFAEGSWNSIFEFAAFIGFDLLDVRNPHTYEYSEATAKKIEILEGEHTETLLQAYKIRRYSLIGRLRASIRKPAFAVMYFNCSIISAWREWKAAW